MHVDRKALDPDCCVAETAATCGEDMLLGSICVSDAECFDIGGVAGGDIDQSRLRGLAGKSLSDSLLVGAFPDRGANRVVVNVTITPILTEQASVTEKTRK